MRCDGHSPVCRQPAPALAHGEAAPQSRSRPCSASPSTPDRREARSSPTPVTLPVLVRGPDGRLSFLVRGDVSPPLGALPYSSIAQDPQCADRPDSTPPCSSQTASWREPGVSIELRLEEAPPHRRGGPLLPPSAVRGGDGPGCWVDSEPGDDVALLAFTLSKLPRQGLHARVPGGAEALASTGPL